MDKFSLVSYPNPIRIQYNHDEKIQLPYPPLPKGSYNVVYQYIIDEPDKHANNVKGTFWLEVPTSNATPRFRMINKNDPRFRQYINAMLNMVDGDPHRPWLSKIFYVAADSDDLREIIKNCKMLGKWYFDRNHAIKDDIPIMLTNVITTYVTNMDDLFRGKSISLDYQLFTWDTRHVRSAKNMFKNTLLNRDSHHYGMEFWDMSNLEFADGMFDHAWHFNDDISNWDLRNLKSANYMFRDANCFNRDISKWNVEKLTGLQGMFDNASAFTANIMNWVPDVIHRENSMHHMFARRVPIDYKEEFKKKWYEKCDNVGDILGEETNNGGAEYHRTCKCTRDDSDSDSDSDSEDEYTYSESKCVSKNDNRHNVGSGSKTETNTACKQNPNKMLSAVTELLMNETHNMTKQILTTVTKNIVAKFKRSISEKVEFAMKTIANEIAAEIEAETEREIAIELEKIKNN